MPQARVRRNNARILASIVEAASLNGWSGVSLTKVGKGAGLTLQPVRSRYPSRVALATAAWSEVVGPELQTALADALASAGLLSLPADPATFASAMEALARPSSQLRASAELAVVACFEPDLAEAVSATLGEAIRGWLAPASAGGPAPAARRGFLLALSLGLISTSQRPVVPDLDLAAQWTALLAALATEHEPAPLPEEPRPPHLELIPFETGDETTDDLLRAAIHHLGRYGYEGTGVASVAADAEVSEATVYARYPSKEAFLVDAIDRQQDISFPAQRDYFARLESRYGIGIAEAVVIRDTMHPTEETINRVEMERVRLTWHRPELAAKDEARLQQVAGDVLAENPGNPDFADPAALHIARALGIGIHFLPLIDDGAWNLPYDVVTVPLNAT